MFHNLKKYNTLIVCLFFISLCLILYNKLLFTNEVINAKDILADHYYGRNGFHKGFIPFDFPLWSTAKLLGTDESHTYFTFHMPDMLFFHKVVPVAPSFAWQMISFLCLGGIFMYLYCRVLGLSYFSSMIAGLFFMMSSEIVTYMNAGHYSKIIMIGYIPLILYFLEKGFQQKKLSNFLIAGAVLGYVFFYKHEQMLFYICLLVGYYTIFRLYYIYKEETSHDFKIVKKLFWFSFIMTIVFLAISACGLLPTLNWGLKHSERSGGVPYNFAISWSMPPEELLGYLFPKIFGLSLPNTFDPGKIKVFYWGRMPFTQGTGYLGIFPLFFTLIALLYNRNKYVKIFGVLILISFFLATGGFNPLYEYVIKFIPGFNLFRVPRTILCMLPLSVSIIAGFGSNWLFYGQDKGKKDKIKKILYYTRIGWIIIGILAISGWIFKDKIIDVFTQTIKWDNWSCFSLSTYKAKYEYFHESVISFLIIFGSIIIWLVLKNLKEVPERLLKIVCIIIFILDVGFINEKFFSTVSIDELVSYNPVTVPQGMKYLKDKGEDIGQFRVFPNIRLDKRYSQANSWALYFQIIGGYTGVKHRLYSDFMQNLDFDNSMIDILNVKYIALDRQAVPYPDIRIGNQVGRYIVDYIDNSIIILRNPSMRDKVHFIFNYIVLQPDDVLPVLSSSKVNPLSTIILEGNPDIKFNSSINTGENSRILSKSIGCDFYDIEVEMTKPGFIVFSDTYNPGWKAYIDGEETKIYKTDYLVRSIFVPAGKHHIVSKFKPLPFILGVWISGLTILGLIILFVLIKMKKIDI